MTAGIYVDKVTLELPEMMHTGMCVVLRAWPTLPRRSMRMIPPVL